MKKPQWPLHEGSKPVVILALIFIFACHQCSIAGTRNSGSRNKGKPFLQLSALITALKLSEKEIKAVSFLVFVAVFAKKISCHKISRPNLFSLRAPTSLRLRGVLMRTD